MKLVYGMGINDADHKVAITQIIDGKRKQVWVCPYYSTWRGILMRCQSSFWVKNSAYQDCTICDEWLIFSNFESWVKEQPNHAEWLLNTKDWAVDKDFLYPGNKVYSPSTCCLLPRYVNNALLDSAKIRGDYPLGVSYHKQHKRFYSCIKVEGKHRFLGLYDEVKDAHISWQTAKVNALKQILEKYRGEEYCDNHICLRLLDTIYLIEEDVQNGQETREFKNLVRRSS